MAARRVIVEARAAQTAAVPSQQIGRDATLIEKDALPDIAHRLPPSPPAAHRRLVRRCSSACTFLFDGQR
jgi:hypothetical protein